MERIRTSLAGELGLAYCVCDGCGAFAEGAAAEALDYTCPTCGGWFEATPARPTPGDPWERPYRVRALVAGEEYSNPSARVV